MKAKEKIVFDQNVRPVYMHLEPVVSLLLKNGNKLARPYRWGQNRTGFFCFLSQPIEFDLIEEIFDVPEFIRLDREHGLIECDKSWATIRGGIS